MAGSTPRARASLLSVLAWGTRTPRSIPEIVSTATPDLSASSDRVKSARERAAFNELLCIAPAFYVGVDVKRFFGILVNYPRRSDPRQPTPTSESINSAGSTPKASASFLLVLGLAGRLFASRSAMVARDTPDFLARSSWESAARSLSSRNRGVFSKFPSSRVWGFGHYRALALHLQVRYETILVHTGMAPRRDRQVSPEARPTELGGSLWTPPSLAHHQRTHPLRITTTP